jgi:hypothetical protein
LRRKYNRINLITNFGGILKLNRLALLFALKLLLQLAFTSCVQRKFQDNSNQNAQINSIKPNINYRIDKVNFKGQEYDVTTLTGAKVRNGFFSLKETFGTKEYGLFIGMLPGSAHFYFIVNGVRVDPGLLNEKWKIRNSDNASEGFLFGFEGINKEEINTFKNWISTKSHWQSPSCVFGTTRAVKRLVKIVRSQEMNDRMRMSASIAFTDMVKNGFIDPNTREKIPHTIYRVDEKYGLTDFVLDARIREKSIMNKYPQYFLTAGDASNEQLNETKDKGIKENPFLEMISPLELLSPDEDECEK